MEFPFVFSIPDRIPVFSSRLILIFQSLKESISPRFRYRTLIWSTLWLYGRHLHVELSRHRDQTVLDFQTEKNIIQF